VIIDGLLRLALSRWLHAAAYGLFVFMAGCEALELRPQVGSPGTLEDPFAVSNFFTPSGHMGDGELAGHIKMNVQNAACRERPPEASGDCYRFLYTPGVKDWAGVYWVYPANNWGSRAGRQVAGERFKQVRLQAASDTDDLPVSFVVGGIADPTLPNRDRVSATTSVRIGRDWQTIRLDIAGQDFDRVVGALAWSLAYPQGWDRTQPVVLYLDDIVWDTDPVPEDPQQ
jgi:hypothetical protein